MDVRGRRLEADLYEGTTGGWRARIRAMIAPMDSFGDVLLLLRRLKTDGIVSDYAIGGAMAVSFWTEPVATQDLDVVITLPAPAASDLDPLREVFTWLRELGIGFTGEHAMVAGVPVQFLLAWNSLVADGVEHAVDLPYRPDDPESPMLRLIPPTYLVAIWQADPAANTSRRRERAAMLREAGLVDEALLAALLSGHRR